MKFPVHNLKGEKVKDIELSESVFGLKPNDLLLHQVYVSQYANRRRVLAHTKDRAERAGSGRKPWRQKGTGRARVGSVRSPIWRKGGVIFGPTKNRNFKKEIPKKMNRKALTVTLSGKAKDKEIIIVDSLKIKEPKTKLIKQTIDNLKLKGSVLFGFSRDERLAKRAIRNLQRVDDIDVENLNVFDILNHKYLVMSEEGIKFLESKYK
ncbi:MAG: 50S ribosomal protein L4 [Candidatus Moranbacteria bacterium CG_4_10_14_3_um_filter_44_15]|nr:MAG: 50S ribosomal protein L4 [Candidatus Moranbacteria bacterium CG06_land_8_20_14_3_00_43_56]PIW93430.1 MAG: 50S ribosomal protein L4 [Candidatus Moranbacteria bacterium CG_4_8_14_3_um_filter_43_15]PIX90800.1 MAG: 50S ribosomal protein L4 [Candidatus Moranbacteria bacterium CG_4_10_14_3_um_filter_44_15]PJA86235.1 MAG: 50S ribosomal protein L4 [Candidatus Moranbacteria bacterium CG_4_9_14_3_um_filter_44_28]